MEGFIVINKPAGITSHDVVGSVRRILKMKKVGHTGTLDPFATGVLPVALGEATKAINFLDESIKEYRAVMYLGISTDSQDCTGQIIEQRDYSHITHDDVVKVFASFLGTIQQVPPMFSAVKQAGIPLYKLARQGTSVHREPREISIISLDVEKIDLPRITFLVRCSRGTYVRTLASDIGDKLRCGAHLTELHRTMSGGFSENDSITLETLSLLNEGDIQEKSVISIYSSLSHLRNMLLTEQGVNKVRRGIIPFKDEFQGFPSEGMFLGERIMLSHENKLLAVVEVVTAQWQEEEKNMRFLRVFN
jgi:tRNA pseudouridine55 synthase